MYGLAKLAYEDFDLTKLAAKYKPFDRERHSVRMFSGNGPYRRADKIPNKFDDLEQEIVHRKNRVEGAQKRERSLTDTLLDFNNQNQVLKGSAKTKTMLSKEPDVQSDYNRLVHMRRKAQNRARVQGAKLNQTEWEKALNQPK